MKLILQTFLTGLGFLTLIVFFYKPSNSDDSNRLINNIYKKPNIVIIFLDDAGWADFEPFDKSISYTPNMSLLAKEARTYNNFYVPQAVCSASRAALLTGCYPGHTKIFGALKPKEKGLDTKFPTFGEIFKSKGYKTAMFGKWHLGDTEETRPWNRGFDETAGLLYSHDMWKHHPDDPKTWGKYPLQFWENSNILIENMEKEDQKSLTKRYTDYAVDFIKRNKNEPFLLYIPHNMPHVPLFVGKDFEGKSGVGMYGDIIMELDWSIGQINQALKDNGIDENTIFIVTSDNGPWLSYGNHSGRTPFREGKTTSFDGGIKSGLIIKYPQMIKGGDFSNSTFFSIDILPTISELAGISLDNNSIDGKSMVGLLSGKSNFENPHQYYAISNLTNLEAVISGDGRWKLHTNHPYRNLIKKGNDGETGVYKEKELEISLFDLKNDPFERFNVKDKYPKIYNKLMDNYKEHYEKFYYK
ncbi:sulfatase-like hydrolase/transferase [Yeosuana marina]|uniref:sulfatase-like hydrolase/transferase n=1 Tax=Yeosuana marina TaxID=1565536 RepID=UPI0030EF3B26|tara:strand:- start:200 stop:1612 length:1413 start_codon:yes stop_codon:yes gene_type:complete